MIGPISMAFMILSFHCANNFAQGLRGDRCEPQDTDPPEDTARQEEKCASNKEAWAQREGENSVCHQSGGERAGGGHLPRSGSSDKGEMEREMTLPPTSSLCTTRSPLNDMVYQQVGATFGER
jgi:hypothetical protein